MALDQIAGASGLPARPIRPQRSINELILRDRIVDKLRAQGVQTFYEVRVPSGIIDILTDTAIYEVKAEFTRSAVQRGIGQLLTYSLDVPGRHLYLVSERNGQGPYMERYAEHYGIGMFLWFEGEEVPL